MKGPLLLSKGNNKPVVIDCRIVENLTQYQIDGVRFLYQQCILKNQNVILNNEAGMNEERQVATFLSAIVRPVPSLVVCQIDCLSKWYYEFSQIDLKVTTASDLIKDDLWEKNDVLDVVLLTHDQLKNLKCLPIENWFFYIVQNLECLKASRFIKNVDSHYRIGIVDKSFIDLSPELQWFAMKWSNSNSVEDKETFLEADQFKKSNFLWPFPDYWRLITWGLIDNLKPTDIEFEEYNKTVKKWCEENNPSLLSIHSPVTRKQPTNKRAATGKRNNSTKRSRKSLKQIEKEELFSGSDSEETTSKFSSVKQKQTVKKKSTTKQTKKRTRILLKQSIKKLASSSDSEEYAISEFSSDSNTQDFKIDVLPKTNESVSPGNDLVIQQVSSSTTLSTISQSKTNYTKSSTDDESNPILDSLFEYSESTSGFNISKKSEKYVEPKSNDNLILNSLIDSQKPSNKHENSVSDSEHEFCPILNSLL